jgi:hypothetical protein
MKRGYYEDPGLNVRIIPKKILKKRCEIVDWINLAHNDQWLPLVNTGINIRVL